jgi:tRNA dimethylallyltransferase
MNTTNKNYCQEKLIVILGPTASGKSDLAVQIAREFNGEIISADSRQVYKGMDIGSGKITKKEMKGVPHYLLDVASPKKRFTVAQFQKLAFIAIKKIQKKNKIPILCGGTGLYIQSIVDGLVLPEVPPDAKLRAKLEKLTTEKLFVKLQKLDLRRAKNIDRHNRRRLIRALEIVIKTGKPVSTNSLLLQRRDGVDFVATLDNHYKNPSYPPFEKGRHLLQLGIGQPKEKLKKLIKKRLLRRLKQGMVSEVLKLHKQGISWKRLEEFGLEYRAIAQYLQNKITKQEMIDKIQKESEQYAKRQITWFKRDKRIKWFKNYKEAGKLTNQFFKLNKKAAEAALN